jgi:hypothetical protein
MNALKFICCVSTLLLIITTTTTAQQTFFVRNGCAVDDAEMGQNHYVFDASPEAGQIIQAIMDANFLQPNFVIKSADCDNALATFENGNRYILYNTSYVERIKNNAGTDWAAYFVFAHEIGHHLSNHSFDLNNAQMSKQQELQADIFAGGMLFRLGATLDEAQAGVNVVCKEKESSTHPPRRARLEAVASGWKRAKDQNGGVQPRPIAIKYNAPVQNNTPTNQEGSSAYSKQTTVEIFTAINLKLKNNELDDNLINLLNEAILREPKNTTICFTLGNVYDNLHQKETNSIRKAELLNNALKYYNQTLSIDDRYTDALYSIGASFYNKAAEFSKIMKALESDFSKQGQKNYEYNEKLMLAEFSKGLPYFQRAESINPNDKNTLIALKEIYSKMNDLSKATEFKNRLQNVENGINNTSYFKY